jgi:alkanesulfonate monooxygenase SsuD/methylene tetrahydromethanopterin reductase-like flavin-dependent oxidoreductase (luciferase family)
MLEIAGREAAGTILWMTGFGAIERHVVPKLRAAAGAAGRPDPRIVAGMHIALTSDADAANERVAQMLEQYRLMPSYRAMIELEGAARPSDFAIVGDEKALDAGIDRLASIGVTDFDANILEIDSGTRERTLDYLASRCA